MYSFSKKSTNRTTLIVSIGLLLASLTQKCFCTTIGCGDSLAAYFAGAFGFFLSWAGSTWLANPLLVTSWFTINRNPKLSLITSFLAVVFSISFLCFNNIIESDAGFYSQIISYKLGYWLWLSSSVTTLLGNSLSRLFRRL